MVWGIDQELADKETSLNFEKEFVKRVKDEVELYFLLGYGRRETGFKFNPATSDRDYLLVTKENFFTDKENLKKFGLIINNCLEKNPLMPGIEVIDNGSYKSRLVNPFDSTFFETFKKGEILIGKADIEEDYFLEANIGYVNRIAHNLRKYRKLFVMAQHYKNNDLEKLQDKFFNHISGSLGTYNDIVKYVFKKESDKFTVHKKIKEIYPEANIKIIKEFQKLKTKTTRENKELLLSKYNNPDEMIRMIGANITAIEILIKNSPLIFYSSLQ